MPAAKPHKRTAPAGRVRIVGGAWRGRLIELSQAPELRPTPDRVRETLFNWLGQRLDGTACLDLYAGSGVLGFEAASRGAARVVLVERDRGTLAALHSTRAALDAHLAGRRMTDREAAEALDVHSNSFRYAAPTGTVAIRWEGARAPVVWIVAAGDIAPADLGVNTVPLASAMDTSSP